MSLKIRLGSILCNFRIHSKYFERYFDTSDCVQGLDDKYEKMHTNILDSVCKDHKTEKKEIIKGI